LTAGLERRENVAYEPDLKYPDFTSRIYQEHRQNGRGSALAGVAIPHVHAAEKNTIQVALVGCGGRGTGAASNALSVTACPIQLVAMADVFDHRLKTSYGAIKREHANQVDVPEDRKYIGFDAYKKAMDCLKPGASRSLHAIGLSLGAFHLRHSKGTERLHGKTADGGWSDFAPDAQARRGRHGEEPQSRRGIDVPPQPGAPGTAAAHPGRRDRRSHSQCAVIGCMDRSVGVLGKMARQNRANCFGRFQRFHSFLWSSGGVSATFTFMSSTTAAG